LALGQVLGGAEAVVVGGVGQVEGNGLAVLVEAAEEELACTLPRSAASRIS